MSDKASTSSRGHKLILEGLLDQGEQFRRFVLFDYLFKSLPRDSQEGVFGRAKAGDVYSEPIGRMHRGHNRSPDTANIGVGISLTSPDREPVTSVVQSW